MPEDDVGSTTHEILAENGLRMINGLNMVNGLSMQNGLNMKNGLNMQNGLRMQNGLEDGNTSGNLMSSADGRATLSYLVRCALPAGSSITKNDQFGTSHTFQGALGFGKDWETGSCNTLCQQYVSACVVAHINTAGVNIPLWIVANPSQQPQIGWGLSSAFPKQEGSFFGNIFVSPPVMNYCDGDNVNDGVVPGRIGADNWSQRPYRNPYGTNAKCGPKNCTRSDFPFASSGYKACSGFNGVVTVFRQ